MIVNHVSENVHNFPKNTWSRFPKPLSVQPIGTIFLRTKLKKNNNNNNNLDYG